MTVDSFPWGDYGRGIVLAVAFAVFLGVVYLLFGTFNPAEARKIYARHIALQKQYDELYKRREEKAARLSEAQKRFEDVTELMKELQRLDKVR
jgi:hypothetical protein